LLFSVFVALQADLQLMNGLIGCLDCVNSMAPEIMGSMLQVRFRVAERGNASWICGCCSAGAAFGAAGRVDAAMVSPAFPFKAAGAEAEDTKTNSNVNENSKPSTFNFILISLFVVLNSNGAESVRELQTEVRGKLLQAVPGIRLAIWSSFILKRWNNTWDGCAGQCHQRIKHVARMPTGRPAGVSAMQAGSVEIAAVTNRTVARLMGARI
jgi:hypothetical protein